MRAAVNIMHRFCDMIYNKFYRVIPHITKDFLTLQIKRKMELEKKKKKYKSREQVIENK